MDSLFLDAGKSLRSGSNIWYRVIQTLGAGGNAVTFLVVATSGPNKGIMFALKIFRKLSKPERRDSFLKEIEFLRAQEHPAIMRIFDDGVFDYTSGDVKNQYPFVVAEYLPFTLRRVLKGDNSSVAEKVSFAIQLLSGLTFLESLKPQVVHRDIKPENIFVKGRACVLGDFGLLKTLDGDEADDREFLKESIGPGMPFFYRTPDLVKYARGEGPLSCKSDVFQLGIVLAELFTGKNPIKRPKDGDILSDVELIALGACPGELSGSISALISRMIKIDEAERPLASELMDGWMGLFENICGKTFSLEGRVF